jgi:hypothetical protein
MARGSSAGFGFGWLGDLGPKDMIKDDARQGREARAVAPVE